YVIRELLRAQMSARQLRELAQKVGPANRLDVKLHDLATLLQGYLDWLDQHRLQDKDRLLLLATEVLQSAQRRPAVGSQLLLTEVLWPETESAPDGMGLTDKLIRIAGLWLDGFAELSGQEIDLLVALLPLCERATLAFNFEARSDAPTSWLDTWSILGQTLREV